MADDQVKLRKTTASIITEDKGEFLGLPGGSIFLVIGTFACVQVMTKKPLFGVAMAACVFGILRYWLRGKPSHYMWYWLWERRAPKRYRPRTDTSEPRLW